MSDRWLEAVTDVLGESRVLIDPGVTSSYTTDWTGRWHGPTRAVLRPTSTEQVAESLRVCSDFGVPVVPQGGNTGLVGGSVPRKLEAVLSLARLGRMDSVDESSATVTVGAGVTLAQLQEHARASTLDFCLDLGARDTATVGGLVATNAGGTHVLRYGSMRAQVLGLEYVLADGTTVSRLEGLVKDNTGYDLTGLLCGSEGTLALVTAATLRMRALLEHRVVALAGLRDVAGALDLLASARRRLPSLEAIELMFPEGIELVCEQAGLPAPLDRRAGCYVLVECAGRSDPTDELGALLEDHEGVVGTAVGVDPAARARLWAYRERHTEAVASLGTQARDGWIGAPHKLDVAVPIDRIPDFAHRVGDAVRALAPQARLILYGHLGDGNLHVNVAGLTDERVDDAVLHLVADFGGAISAEHGIGIAKRNWLTLTRSRHEIDLMRGLKRAWDPDNLLNPGVLFPPARH
ncbi:MAG: FAD-binding oxidoreductase [Actinomycetota bacterium]